MDDLDRAILEKLCEDARLSQRKLAQLLGVAQGTVTKRMQRMEESGLIKNYAAVLDAEKVGWSMTIMAGLRIQKGRMIEVQEKIASDPRVFNVYDITGDWDSMVLARVKDRSDLDNLTKTVFTQDGVIRSYTHVVLNTVKEEGVRLPRLGHENQ
ncbi:MAG: Lrp/AsnC family transcriptional regulator [Candidatus Thermoplasmatota archaeon]|nr:Lrp/AsnC family transcriptional regulator [Candidatus Thermoplasmatota archaeon]